MSENTKPLNTQAQSMRRNLIILFFTLVVVMLGFGMIIPILPFYIKSFGASGSALGGLMAVYGLMQFIFAPIWGSLSDRYGRKPILLLGVAGNAISQLLFGLSSQLWMLFVARALGGILSSATFPTAMAYVGDSTSKEQRSGGMGVVGAAMGIGMVLGPGIGGFLAEKSLNLPFFIAAGLSVLAFIPIILALPEPGRNIQIVERTAKKAQGPRLAALWQALAGPLGILFGMSFLLSFGLTNFESVFGLYAVERYNYGPERVGFILTIVGLLSAAMQGLMTGPLTRRFGEGLIIRGSLLFSALGFMVMLLARNLPEVLLTVGFFIISNAMLNPSVASMISKRATSGQGITLGLNNSFLSLGRIAGPLWAGFAFDQNLNAPYLTGAIVMLAGFIFSVVKLETEIQAVDLVEAENP